MTTKEKIGFLETIKSLIPTYYVAAPGLCHLAEEAADKVLGVYRAEKYLEWLDTVLPETKFAASGEEISKKGLKEAKRLGIGCFCFPIGPGETFRERFYYYRLKWLDEQILKLKEND